MRMLHWGDCKATIEQQLVEIKKLNKELDEYHAYINLNVDQFKRHDEIFKIQNARIQELEQENVQLSEANNYLAQRVKNLEALEAPQSKIINYFEPHPKIYDRSPIVLKDFAEIGALWINKISQEVYQCTGASLWKKIDNPFLFGKEKEVEQKAKKKEPKSQKQQNLPKSEELSEEVSA